MPASTVFDDLLGNQANAAAKKGAMKTADGGAVSSRVGLAKKLAGHHLGDGKTLTLEMQVICYCLIADMKPANLSSVDLWATRGVKQFDVSTRIKVSLALLGTQLLTARSLVGVESLLLGSQECPTC